MTIIAILLFFFSLVPIVLHQEFKNVFLQICIYIIAISFTYYAYLHWLVRIIGGCTHLFVILVMESFYLRELLLQLACYDLGKYLHFVTPI